MVGKDPEYFSRWGNSQEPDFLYIGCADSRVPVRPATSKTCPAKALLPKTAYTAHGKCATCIPGPVLQRHCSPGHCQLPQRRAAVPFVAHA